MNTDNIIKIITLLVLLILILESISLTFDYSVISEKPVTTDDYKPVTTNSRQQYTKDSLPESNNIKIDESIQSFIGMLDNTPLLTIEIEKINILKNVYQIGSKENNVDKNITIMKESDMPNIKNGNLILGAHSGTGEVAYFTDLIKLQSQDEVIIEYDSKKYIYEIEHQYDALKSGRITIRRDYNKTTLTLFTCNPTKKDKNLIVIAYLKEIN